MTGQVGLGECGRVVNCTPLTGQVGLGESGRVARSLTEQAEIPQIHSVSDNPEPNEASGDYRPPP